MNLSLSPKVLGSTALVLAACLALWLITGDETYLVGVLIGIAGGGAGFALPTATAPEGLPNLTQDEAVRLASLPRRERDRLLPPAA